MSESWQDIPGYEGWYQASDHGSVRVLQRVRGFRWGGKSADSYPLILTPLVYRKGYLKVSLGRCGGRHEKPRREFIHRVVWKAFNGPIPKGITVNHIDGDKANNRLDNLELATHLEQVHHARSLGLMRHATEDGYVTDHLTADDVLEIRRLREEEGWTYVALAERFNVVKGTIGHIVQRRTWKHL